MGDFLNEFVANMQALPALIVLVTLGLPTFSYFYNRLMDRLNGRTSEHTSLYVVGGVGVTLIAGALFSWKAALLYMVLFGLSGLPMIVGEFLRTERNQKAIRTSRVRRKRLPYAANGCIEDAHHAMREAERLLVQAMKENGTNARSAVPIAYASQQISKAMTKIVELKLIQNIDS